MIDILDNEIFIMLHKIFLDTEEHPVSVFAHFITNPFQYSTEILAEFFESLPPEHQDRVSIVFDYFVEFDSFDVYLLIPEKRDMDTKKINSKEMNEIQRYLKDQELKLKLDKLYPIHFLKELFVYAASTCSEKEKENTLVIRYCYKTSSFFCNYFPTNTIITSPFQESSDKIHIRMVKYVLF